MPKTQTQYVCQQCGRTSPRLLGKCPQCGSWGSMVEEVVSVAAPAPQRSVASGLGGHSTPQALNQVQSEGEERLRLPISEFARVLGDALARIDVRQGIGLQRPVLDHRDHAVPDLGVLERGSQDVDPFGHDHGGEVCAAGRKQ